MIRHPAVAGQFYPGTPKALTDQIAGFIREPKQKEKVVGAVSPHAGYIYSGKVAGQLYSRIEIPQTAVIIGPNHRGVGADYAIMTDGEWATPLGNVQIDTVLAGAILKHCRYVKEDREAHRYEHSLEVQVPFLQYLRKDIRIVPLCIGAYDEAAFDCIGACIAEAIQETKTDALIIASSDMSHYEPATVAKKKDDQAIEAILQLDPGKMLRRVSRLNISMCGYAPTAIMLAAAKELGARKGELVAYMNSGDATGDYHEVVGYAGITIA